jgi:hypothetical protein
VLASSDDPDGEPREEQHESPASGVQQQIRAAREQPASGADPGQRARRPVHPAVWREQPAVPGQRPCQQAERPEKKPLELQQGAQVEEVGPVEDDLAHPQERGEDRGAGEQQDAASSMRREASEEGTEGGGEDEQHGLDQVDDVAGDRALPLHPVAILPASRVASAGATCRPPESGSRSSPGSM